MSKRRRAEGGFPGAAVVQKQLAEGPARLRVGIKPVDKAPARAHTVVTDLDGNAIGEITSGGFGPTVNGPVAMGYVSTAFSKEGTAVKLLVRGIPRDANIVAMPFAPHRYCK
jgi:aminomethyltransferase